jgi:hypothetical protein
MLSYSVVPAYALLVFILMRFGVALPVPEWLWDLTD